MPETFILIPGRTSRQGCGISEGKFGQEYQEETHVLQVAPGHVEARAERIIAIGSRRDLVEPVGVAEPYADPEVSARAFRRIREIVEAVVPVRTSI